MRGELGVVRTRCDWWGARAGEVALRRPEELHEEGSGFMRTRWGTWAGKNEKPGLGFQSFAVGGARVQERWC
eukprot:1158891-Pelagomonas_calceolata.AAC.8